jgi:hypothetical protein
MNIFKIRCPDQKKIQIIENGINTIWISRNFRASGTISPAFTAIQTNRVFPGSGPDALSSLRR